MYRLADKCAILLLARTCAYTCRASLSLHARGLSSSLFVGSGAVLPSVGAPLVALLVVWRLRSV
jgi:hypothetical protein